MDQPLNIWDPSGGSGPKLGSSGMSSSLASFAGVRAKELWPAGGMGRKGEVGLYQYLLLKSCGSLVTECATFYRINITGQTGRGEDLTWWAAPLLWGCGQVWGVQGRHLKLQFILQLPIPFLHQGPWGTSVPVGATRGAGPPWGCVNFFLLGSEFSCQVSLLWHSIESAAPGSLPAGRGSVGGDGG